MRRAAVGPSRLARLMLVATVAVAVLAVDACGSTPAPAAAPEHPRHPNIVVIMTDDQTVESMRALPQVRSLIGDHGVTFTSSIVSFPVCCPSRTTYLTGQYVHNHHVRGNDPPFGGYPAFRHQETTFPASLQRAGYHTVHIGKYLNHYGTTSPVVIPPGWTEWHGALDPTTYSYFDFTLLEHGRKHRYGHRRSDYQTDVYTRIATRAIRRTARVHQPLFLNVAYLAPHAQALPARLATAESRAVHDAVPAPRDRGHYAHEPLPTPRSYDEADVTDKPAVVRALPRIDRDMQRRITQAYRRYLGSLRAVDRGVGEIVDALRDTGQLDDTVLIFTSDNGFFFGEHRIPGGKGRFYEPSIRVPLMVRGPGIRSGVVNRSLVANIDLAPTILDLAHASPLRTMDGRSLVPLLRRGGEHRDRAVLLEVNGLYTPDFGVRTDRYAYFVLHTGEHELYDLRSDPDELHNRSGDPALAPEQAALEARLDALRSCEGPACDQPGVP